MLMPSGGPGRIFIHHWLRVIGLRLKLFSPGGRCQEGLVVIDPAVEFFRISAVVTYKPGSAVLQRGEAVKFRILGR